MEAIMEDKKPEDTKPTDFSKPDSPSVKIYLSQHMRKKRKKAVV